MLKLKKVLTVSVSSIFTFFTIVSGYFLAFRYGLDYNSEGKYFDPETMVVYEEQSIIILFLLFLILGILSIFCWLYFIFFNKN